MNIPALNAAKDRCFAIGFVAGMLAMAAMLLAIKYL